MALWYAPRLPYPIGDDRNKTESRYITFKICPLPCESGGVKVSSVCSGGIEINDSDPAEITEFTINSISGNFKYLDYMSVNPLCPSGYYEVRFIQSDLVQIINPSVAIIGGLRYIGNDIAVYMLDPPFTTQLLFTLEAGGWSGVWQIGDCIFFYVQRNETSQYEAQTLQIDLCPKYVTSKCAYDHNVIELCICPIYKTNKCSCNYDITDLHWAIITEQDERYRINWTNPPTCCVQWIKLYTPTGPKLIEYNGNSFGFRAKPESPAYILTDGHPEWDNYTHWSIEGDDGWICDRLRWLLVEPHGWDAGGYYSIYTHGTLIAGIPGEPLSVSGSFKDEGCSGEVILASLFLETVGLIGGRVEQIVDVEDDKEYVVNIKGISVQIKAADFTAYDVDDWVAIQKIGAEPPRGFPTISIWLDDNGILHDPIPYITDENVPKVDPSGNIIIFESESVLVSGYYDDNMIGSPNLAQFAASEIINNYVQITQGPGRGQQRTVTSFYDGKCYVDKLFGPIPTADSKFRVISSTVFETNNLRIIPYQFRHA